MSGPVKIKTYDDTHNDHCPSCGNKVDAVTSVGPKGGKSYPGAITICLKCGEVMKFDENLKLVMFPLNELVKLSLDQRRLLNILQQFVKNNAKERSDSDSQRHSG